MDKRLRDKLKVREATMMLARVRCISEILVRLRSMDDIEISLRCDKVHEHLADLDNALCKRARI